MIANPYACSEANPCHYPNHNHTGYGAYDPPPPAPPVVITEAPDEDPGEWRTADQAAAIERIKARVVAQMDAFHIAIGHAESWARAAQKRTFVVRNDGRYHLADMAVLREFHRRDIYLHRANIVYMARG